MRLLHNSGMPIFIHIIAHDATLGSSIIAMWSIHIGQFPFRFTSTICSPRHASDHGSTNTDHIRLSRRFLMRVSAGACPSVTILRSLGIASFSVWVADPGITQMAICPSGQRSMPSISLRASPKSSCYLAESTKIVSRVPRVLHCDHIPGVRPRYRCWGRELSLAQLSAIRRPWSKDLDAIAASLADLRAINILTTVVI